MAKIHAFSQKAQMSAFCTQQFPVQTDMPIEKQERLFEVCAGNSGKVCGSLERESAKIRIYI